MAHENHSFVWARFGKVRPDRAEGDVDCVREVSGGELGGRSDIDDSNRFPRLDALIELFWRDVVLHNFMDQGATSCRKDSAQHRFSP